MEGNEHNGLPPSGSSFLLAEVHVHVSRNEEPDMTVGTHVGDPFRGLRDVIPPRREPASAPGTLHAREPIQLEPLPQRRHAAPPLPGCPATGVTPTTPEAGRGSEAMQLPDGLESIGRPLRTGREWLASRLLGSGPFILRPGTARR